MKLNKLNSILKPKVSERNEKEWVFIRECFEEFYPKIPITRIHKSIFHLISSLYDTSNENIQIRHLHLPFNSESFTKQLGIFLMVILRFKELPMSLSDINQNKLDCYYYINNKLERSSSLTRYLSKYSSELSGSSSIFNVLFEHGIEKKKNNSKEEFHDPEGLTGIQWRKLIDRRKENIRREILNYRFLGKLIDYYVSNGYIDGVKELSLLPSILFICLAGFENWLKENYSQIWNFSSIEELTRASLSFSLKGMRPVITNSKISYNEFYDDDGYYQIKDQSIFYDLTRTIVLFNTTGRSLYDGFNYQRLEEHVEEYGGELRRVLIITFNKEKFYSFIRTRETIQKINERYKVNIDNNSITITSFDFQNNFKYGRILFNDIGIYYILCSFYETLFTLNTDAYTKFLSLWFFNMLSNTHSESIQKIIWRDIVKEIGDVQDNEELKELFFKLTTLIIQRNRALFTASKKENNLKAIIPSAFLKDSKYQSSISDLRKEFRIHFIGWDDLQSDFDPHTRYLVLDYRDSRYDHKFVYNVFDLLLNSENVECHFLLELFKKRFFLNTKNYVENIVSPILISKTRKAYFNFSSTPGKPFIKYLEDEIRNIRSIDSSFEDIDDTNYESPSAESIKVFFQGRRQTLNKSEKLLVRKIESTKYSITRADELIDLADVNLYEGQRIYDLYEDFNPFDENKSDKNEIENFKFQLNIDLPEDEWLWKYLLKRKVDETSIDKVYKDLKNLSEHNNFFLISKKTFLKSYLNPKDQSLPREKKVTKAICHYLNLPSVYYRLVVKFKARQVLQSRKSNSKMDKLINTLIDFELFPNFKSDKFHRWFKHIREVEEIDLEDVGIFENVEEEIEVLVELLAEKLKLRKIKQVKVSSDD